MGHDGRRGFFIFLGLLQQCHEFLNCIWRYISTIISGNNNLSLQVKQVNSGSNHYDKGRRDGKEKVRGSKERLWDWKTKTNESIYCDFIDFNGNKVDVSRHTHILGRLNASNYKDEREGRESLPSFKMK
jgi:hypothetical protein